MTIEITPEGWAVIAGDTHIGQWVKECKRLDHDQWMLGLLKPHINLGDTVLDIGANIGDHTVAYCDWVGPVGTVYAFEPQTEAYICLHRNTLKFENCVRMQLALSDIREQVFMRPQNNFGARFLEKAENEQDHFLTSTLDNLHIPNVNFIKIDAEGYELKILKGAEQTLKTHHPKLCLEINVPGLTRNSTSVNDLMIYLENLGYKSSVLQKGLPADAQQYDILCL